MNPLEIPEAHRRAIADCNHHGHLWAVQLNASGQPRRILCERCGEWFPIADKRYEGTL